MYFIWNEENLKVLKNMYKTHSHEEIAEHLGTDRNTVANKCSNLKWLKRDNLSNETVRLRNNAKQKSDIELLPLWKKEDIEFLKDNLMSMTNGELSENLNIAKNQVMYAIRKLGLSRRFWNEEKHQFLRDNYDGTNAEELAEKLGTTTSKVYSKVSKLQLTTKMREDLDLEDLPNEKWLFMLNRKYKLSNMGRVRNAKHGNLLKPSKGDYPYVELDGKNYRIHILVAKGFVVNPDPKIYTIVNHKDGDKTNFKYTNLEWTTYKGNTKHAIDTGLFFPEERKNLTSEQIHTMCGMLVKGVSSVDIVKTLGLAESWKYQMYKLRKCLIHYDITSQYFK